MGYPRHLYVPADTRGVYHCVSRCVRRAFLCGQDDLTGRSFEHRRQWIEERIVQLAAVFAVAIHGYSVMSNHFHLIIETDPGAPKQWSDEEVARRWLALSAAGHDNERELSMHIARLVENPQRLAVLRERLGSLSWYMRYLKEPIARRANTEDECKGRFWEGRFRAQALLDDAAVLSSMVYVDLNPMRAGIAKGPRDSVHTSVCERSKQASDERDGPLLPLAGSIGSAISVATTDQYLELVEWTGRALHSRKRGVAAEETPTLIRRLGLRSQQWCLQVPATESHYWRAIGCLESLMYAANMAGHRWLCGISMARRLQRITD